MGAMELLTGNVTAPGTTFTGLTMASGNSLTMRLSAPDTKIWLLNAWADSQGAGNLRIRAPQLHDNVQGIRLFHVAGEPEPLLPWGLLQNVNAQETLTVDMTGSATAGDIEVASLLMYYESLPGISGKFIKFEDMMARAVDMVAVENTITGGTSGGYSGEEAINAEFDLLRANTDYALMGYMTSLEVGSVRYRSIDFGNLGVGGPGHAERKSLTANWFANMAKKLDMPLIPVFNSANRAGTLIDIAKDENAQSPVITTLLVELSPT